jgi:hypothetical protein
MKSHICEATHPEAELRCWKRDGHDGPHLTVLPNVDTSVRTRPVATRW